MAASTIRQRHAAKQPVTNAQSTTAADSVASTAQVSASIDKPTKSVHDASSPFLLLKRILPSFSLFTLTLSLYLHTAYPSISGGDSGELAVASCLGGVAHPPGYPTFTALMHYTLRMVRFMSLHAAEKPAVVFHSVNSIMSAAASVVLYQIALRLTADSTDESGPSLGSILLSCLCSLSFSLSSTVWLYTIQTEVFALNNLLCTLLIYSTCIYWSRLGRLDRIMYSVEQSHVTAVLFGKTSEDASTIAVNATAAKAAAKRENARQEAVRSLHTALSMCSLWSALCMTNQHTTVLFALPIGLACIATLLQRRLLTPQLFASQLCMLSIGLSPYAWLPWRSSLAIADAWGIQSSLSGFITHVSRAEYGTFQLAAHETSLLQQHTWFKLLVYASEASRELHISLVIAAAIGLLATVAWPLLHALVRTESMPSSLSRRESPLLLQLRTLLASCLVIYTLVFHYLANLDLTNALFIGVFARFWQQSNLLLCLFSVLGLQSVVQSMDTLLRSSSNLQSVRPFFAPSVYALVLSLYSFRIVTDTLPSHSHQFDSLFSEIASSTLRSFPNDAIVLLNGDLNTNLVKYQQQCELVRTDLSLISLQLMSWSWFVPLHRDNYPGVDFPGERYHVSGLESFNIRQFLDANRQRAVFLCGDWKTGDTSYKRADGVPVYELLPHGMCSQIVRFEKSRNVGVKRMQRHFKWMHDVLHSNQSLIDSPLLRSYDPVRHPRDSWETAMYRDLWQRVLYTVSWSGFMLQHRLGSSGVQADISPAQARMLEITVRVVDQFYSNPEAVDTVFERLKVGDRAELRSAGVVYGHAAQYHTIQAAKAPETIDRSVAHDDKLIERLSRSEHTLRAEDHSRSMLRCWSLFLQYKPAETEIRYFVESRINPYNNRKVEVTEAQAEMWKLPPHKVQTQPPAYRQQQHHQQQQQQQQVYVDGQQRTVRMSSAPDQPPQPIEVQQIKPKPKKAKKKKKQKQQAQSPPVDINSQPGVRIESA